MNQVVKVEIPVEPATPRAPTNAARLSEIGHLVDRIVQPGEDDPLAALLARTEHAARAAGLTEAEIAAELVAYNAERRG